MSLQNKKLMLPPWLAFRELDRYSISWRMGATGDYLLRFDRWFRALAPEEQKEYRSFFPEPVTWNGWWEAKDTREMLERGSFSVQAWRPGGYPKYTRRWLEQEFAAGRKRGFCTFWQVDPAKNKNGVVTSDCLSQWWMADFEAADNTYRCAEQYMMASKARLFGDRAAAEKIMGTSDPAEQKKLGKGVHDFDPVTWDKFNRSVIVNGNWLKFSQNRPLADFLLSTGDSVLAEASPYDKIWGIGLDASDSRARNPQKWQGQNLLGFALMEVRDELRRVNQNEMMCDERLTYE